MDEAIEIKFKAVDKRLDSEINHRKEDIQTLERELNAKIDDHDHTLYGNGQPGLKTDVQELKTTFKVVVTLLKWQIGILAPFLVCMVGAILAFIFGKL